MDARTVARQGPRVAVGVDDHGAVEPANDVAFELCARSRLVQPPHGDPVDPNPIGDHVAARVVVQIGGEGKDHQQRD